MLNIEKAGNDVCSLTGKETEGCYVTMDDGSKGFMSWKAIKSYVNMRTAMKAKEQPQPAENRNGAEVRA